MAISWEAATGAMDTAEEQRRYEQKRHDVARQNTLNMLSQSYEKEQDLLSPMERHQRRAQMFTLANLGPQDKANLLQSSHQQALGEMKQNVMMGGTPQGPEPTAAPAMGTLEGPEGPEPTAAPVVMPSPAQSRLDELQQKMRVTPNMPMAERQENLKEQTALRVAETGRLTQEYVGVRQKKAALASLEQYKTQMTPEEYQRGLLGIVAPQAKLTNMNVAMGAKSYRLPETNEVVTVFPTKGGGFVKQDQATGAMEPYVLPTGAVPVVREFAPHFVTDESGNLTVIDPNAARAAMGGQVAGTVEGVHPFIRPIAIRTTDAEGNPGTTLVHPTKGGNYQGAKGTPGGGGFFYSQPTSAERDRADQASRASQAADVTLQELEANREKLGPNMEGVKNYLLYRTPLVDPEVAQLAMNVHSLVAQHMALHNFRNATEAHGWYNDIINRMTNPDAMIGQVNALKAFSERGFALSQTGRFAKKAGGGITAPPGSVVIQDASGKQRTLNKADLEAKHKENWRSFITQSGGKVIAE